MVIVFVRVAVHAPVAPVDCEAVHSTRSDVSFVIARATPDSVRAESKLFSTTEVSFAQNEYIILQIISREYISSYTSTTFLRFIAGVRSDTVKKCSKFSE